MHLTAVFLTVSALASSALAQAPVSFTSVPSVANAGESVVIEYLGDPNAPATITLRKGNPQALETVRDITTEARGGSFTWVVPSDLPAGSDYAFQISQGGSINYSGQLPIVGGTPALASAISSAASAAASSAAASATSSAAASAASSAASSISESIVSEASATASSIASEVSASASAALSSATAAASSAVASVSTRASTTASATASRTSASTSTVPTNENSASGLGSSPAAFVLAAFAAIVYLY